MPRDNLTRGGTGAVRGTGSGPDADDDTDDASNTADTNTDDESVPDDIQREGSNNQAERNARGGAAPRTRADVGGGADDTDVDEATDTDADTDGDADTDDDSGGAPDDVQRSGGGGDGRGQVRGTPGVDTDSPPRSDDGGDRPDGPPDSPQQEGPDAGDADMPDRRAGPGRSATGDADESADDDTDDDAADEADGGISSRVEERVVSAREYLDANDVTTVVRDGAEKVRLTASGAAAKFAASREDLDEEDVTATNNDDGGFDIELSEDYREEQLEEGFQRGPVGAGATISGEAGISDQGSPDDPLEGTGLERGLGETADQARQAEQRVVDQLDRAEASDVEVVQEDGQLVVVDNRPSVPDDVGRGDPPGENRLRRQTTGRTPDATTAAANELVNRVEAELDERGIDRDDVTVDTTVEDGQLRAEVEPRQDEEFGDFAIRLPTAQDQDNFAQSTVESAVGAAFGPIGAATSTVAGVAADTAGVGGERSEDVLGSTSDRINQAIAEAAPAGGDAVEDAVASSALGPAFSRTTASTLADLGLEAADDRSGGLASEVADEYTEGAFVGAASLADVSGTVVGVKEGGEFVVEGAEETAAGRGGEFTSKAFDAGVTAAAGFESYAKKNPFEAAGTVSGALAASTISMGTAGALSSRAGTATRFAVQPGEELISSATGNTASRLARGASANVRSRVGNSNFLSDTRGQAQVPVPREVDEPDSGSVDAGDAGGFDPDRGTILEGSPRDRMSDDVSGRAISETQAADGDFELSPRQLREGSRQDMATFDPDDVPATAEQPGAARRPESPGEDFSGFLRRERQLREEFGTEEPSVSAELDGTADFGTGGEAAFRAVESNALTGFESLEMQQEPQQQEVTSPFGDTARGELESEGESEIEAEGETELYEETGLETAAEENQAFDVRQEQAASRSLDFEQEQQQEQESRRELESRFEAESESEQRLDSTLFGDDDDDDDVFAGTSVSDEVFDTGVVQGLDEL